MAENARTSINDAVGEALAFTRTHARFIATLAAAGAGVLTLLAAIRLSASPLQLVLFVASFACQAAVYAALIGAALRGPAELRARIVADTGRLMAAMAVIGFFLFIVLFVALMPGVMVLALGPLAPYADELQAAGGDQAAAMVVMTRFMQENPLPLLIFMTAYLALWLLLTSRLYLAAPASIDRGRVLTFETWSWTKGAMLRIAFARLMLLAPAYVLVMTIAFIVGRLVGVDPMAPAVTASGTPALLLYLAVLSVLNFAVYSALEAGLSAAFYRRLAPPAA